MRTQLDTASVDPRKPATSRSTVVVKVKVLADCSRQPASWIRFCQLAPKVELMRGNQHTSFQLGGERTGAFTLLLNFCLLLCMWFGQLRNSRKYTHAYTHGWISKRRPCIAACSQTGPVWIFNMFHELEETRRVFRDLSQEGSCWKSPKYFQSLHQGLLFCILHWSLWS